MKALGYCALVRLAPLANAFARIDSIAKALLTGREEDVWKKCASRRRKIEFLGGRIAGKLAVNIQRESNGETARSWKAIEIYPQENGAPICEHDDGSRYPISISHSRNWALALVGADHRAVAIDVEDAESRVQFVADMFHEIELARMRDLKDAQARWTLKEVCGKLTGKGLEGCPHNILTVRGEDKSLWLLPPASMTVPRSSVLAAGNCGLLTVAVGFDLSEA